MWVRTKEKNALYNISGVRITHSLRGFFLDGFLVGVEKPIELAEYTSYEDALEQLNAVEAFICEDKKGVLQIK